MVLDIMDIEKFIKVNEMQPVTSPLFFDKDGMPNKQGLFSYEIFGIPGSYDRRNRFAYIDLNGKFITPHVYKLLITLNRKYAQLLSGESYFIFDENIKDFVLADEENPDAETGVDMFYKYYDQLILKETESRKRSDRIELIRSMKKDEIFISRWIVIPAFYRDMNYEKMSYNDLNNFYKKLITNASSLKTIMSDDNFSYTYTKSIIQRTINEIHDHFLGLVELKEGFLHQAVMGKTIDYGTRTLISAPSFSANKWSDMPASFTHAAVPLSQVVPEFTLHIQAWIHDWIEGKVAGQEAVYVYDDIKKIIFKKYLHKNWKEDYTYDKIQKQITLFVSSPEFRFDPVTIRIDNGLYYPFIYIRDDRDIVINEKNAIDPSSLKDIRFMTWTDLFYIAAVDVTKDKHVVITRYPITDYHSEYYAKVKVRSTIKTKNMLIGDTLYDQYPVIDLNMPKDKIDGLFIDSLELFPPYIGTLGADHDGDMVVSRGLFTKEANEEADNYINSIANCIGLNASSVRTPGDVATHTLYNLTRD